MTQVDAHGKFGTGFNPEDRYRLLVEAVTDYAIYLLDAQGFIASWNPGAQRLKGYTEAEILGRHVSVFYPEEDARAGLPAKVLSTAAREGRFEAEGWRVRKDGTRFWANVIVDPVYSPARELLGFAKVTRDLSERRVAEESLRRSEEQLRLLVQGVTDYAIYMVDANGIVTSWNPGAQRIKGYAPDEVIGTHFSRFYRVPDRERGEPARTLATAAREGRYEAEGWRVRKDGSQFWANVVVDPIRDASGTIIGFAKITRDMTEKREAQLALEQAREALFQAQKLDAIGQLTGGVAHDFNNLLMVVLSSLELLRRRLPQDEKLHRLLETAVSGARRGASLTQRLLAFARRQALDPRAVRVDALLRSMGDLLARTLGPAIRIDQRFEAALPPVLVDPNQLELAILNLAINARDAMPDGGRIEIDARAASVDAQAAGGPAPGRYVRLALRDEGAGMDADTLARATEPFFTTKGVGKGTGLGLPMVHGLAAQSGGHFVLDSTPGAGTTATLWLPLAPEDAHAATAQAADASAHAPPGDAAARRDDAARGLRVLAVDDDSLVLASTAAMLEELGHAVVSASSADEALALLERERGIDLVITDHAMPGLSGVQLIDAIRRTHARLPVVLATGYAEPAPEVGPRVPRLTKPFDQQALARAITAATTAPA